MEVRENERKEPAVTFKTKELLGLAREAARRADLLGALLNEAKLTKEQWYALLTTHAALRNLGQALEAAPETPTLGFQFAR